jgi:hypothetical protein
MNIHNYKRQFERNLERIQESKEISKENKKVIIDFKDYLLSEGIGIARINRFFYELMKYSKMFKKLFIEASKDDIRAIVAEVEQTDLSAETKKCSKIVLKKLYKFIKGIDEEGKYPKEFEDSLLALKGLPLNEEERERKRNYRASTKTKRIRR